MMRPNPRNSSSQLTASSVSEFSTKQLSKRTWSDFERLFESHPAPGAYPCWCMYNHRCGVEKKTPRAIWIKRNHNDKRELVEQGRSRGILVYSHGAPVGWCQYGLMEELPRIDNNPKYRKLASASDKMLWRITCFVVRKKYRRSGVARTALKAALAAIQKQGDGVVEAYPIKRWGAYADYRGTVSMFEKEGFQIVAPLSESNVLMRRIL